MIDFARIWAFALLPLPFAAWRVLPTLVGRNAIAVPPGVWQVLTRARPDGAAMFSVLRRRRVARTLGWVLAVTALAGPETVGQRLIEPTGRDVMIAIDLSASMGEPRKDALPGTATRQIDIVRPFAADLVARRRGDRVGLIAFGSDAYLISPLTFDTGAVAAMLAEVAIGLPGRRTDLGQAIGLTVRILRARPAAERVLIMISDGETNAGDLAALDAAALAAGQGITIHVVGFSSEVSPENAAHMAQVAGATGGHYFEATSDDALAGVTAAIDRVLPSAARAEPDRLKRSWAWLPALMALVALGLVARRELAGA